MSSEFASTMSTAVGTLSEGIGSFTGSTITAGIWEGDAANNAKTQKEQKIDKKVEDVQGKLDNLISAIAKGNEAIIAKENLDLANEAYNNIMNDTTLSQAEKESKVKDIIADKQRFKNDYDDAIKEVKSLCSGTKE